MDIEEEFLSYIQFCEENFSNSVFLKRNNMKIIKEVYTCLEVIDIYEGLSIVEESETIQKFLRDLEYLLINLLYVFPTNNSLYYATCIRAIAEVCLRICVASQFSQLDYESINNLGFRTLEEKLKNTYQVQVVTAENFKQLKVTFGEYSKVLHNKGNKIDLQLLEQLVKEKQLDDNKIKSNVKVIKNFCVNTISIILGVKDADFSTAQKIRVMNLSK